MMKTATHRLDGVPNGTAVYTRLQKKVTSFSHPILCTDVHTLRGASHLLLELFWHGDVPIPSLPKPLILAIAASGGQSEPV